ncbi:PREDICTED: natural killer cells antigen CD94-like isoform X2 [Gekko japonicus]|uniref:Natural killer cells antigen CD94-like isoform X2 n=1 Tax=Gekko japonicus TaxID=146911 RepID=A0ABM1K311_GEKJA|nr:PREDICTED: natural killer cells antigen CD94-like isoform X2 [Gekko japonicus]
MVADLSEGTGGRSDCENPVGKNLANGHMVNASEQEMLFLQGHLVKGGICENRQRDSRIFLVPPRIRDQLWASRWSDANGNKWKWSTIGLLVLLVISVTTNIYALAKLCQRPAALRPRDTMSSSSDASPCPQRWVMNQGRCYFFSDTEATWNASWTDCSSHGGSLVAMDTPQEWDFVSQSKRPRYYWIGLWRTGAGELWKRANGSLFNNSFLKHLPCPYVAPWCRIFDPYSGTKCGIGTPQR